MLLQPRGSTVSVPDGQQQSLGMGMRNTTIGTNNTPGLGMGQPTSIAEKLRAVLGSSLAQTNNNGYNWSQHATNLYEDDALRQLKGGVDISPESDSYFIERVAGAMEVYMQHIFHRSQSFYEVYKRGREEFRLTINGLPCEVRGAFIDEVSKMHDFTRIVATAGAPFFGKKLVDQLKDGSREQFTQNDYLDAAFIAIRNILSLELINWLMKSRKGREYAVRLPKEIQSRINNLEQMKDFTNSVFDFFGLTSPYANLEFKIPEVVRPDFQMLYGGVTNFTQNYYTAGAGNAQIVDDPQGNEDLLQLVYRNAQEATQTPNFQRTARATEESMSMSWDETRTDLQNLNADNKHLFNLGRFFHNIGKPDHYFIEDEMWQRIRHAFNKHSQMGKEQTCLPGTFRIVICDLQNNSGWHSTIVRSDDLDMQYVLSNPAKLLPLLEDPTLQKTWDVTNYNLSDQVEKNTLTIDIAECVKLEKGLPVTTFDKLVESRGTPQIYSSLEILNKNITKNYKKTNVVSFNVATWDTFTCSSVEDRIRIRDDLPFLFKDIEIENNPSFYQACRKLRAYFAEGIVNGEVGSFICSHLTNIVNNWLINCGGYSAVVDQFGRALSVDDVFEDIVELVEYLKERDPTAYHWLTQTHENHFLLENLKIFTLDNPYNKVDEEDIVSTAKYELELQVVRNLYLAVVNNRQGPHYVEKDIPLVIKRSAFPEYFDMVEKSFDSTLAVTGGGDIKITDKLIKFSENGTLWLFSYSMVDENVATLRRVEEAGTLVLLPLK